MAFFKKIVLLFIFIGPSLGICASKNVPRIVFVVESSNKNSFTALVEGLQKKYRVGENMAVTLQPKPLAVMLVPRGLADIFLTDVTNDETMAVTRLDAIELPPHRIDIKHLIHAEQKSDVLFTEWIDGGIAHEFAFAHSFVSSPIKRFTNVAFEKIRNELYLFAKKVDFIYYFLKFYVDETGFEIRVLEDMMVDALKGITNIESVLQEPSDLSAILTAMDQTGYRYLMEHASLAGQVFDGRLNYLRSRIRSVDMQGRRFREKTSLDFLYLLSTGNLRVRDGMIISLTKFILDMEKRKSETVVGKMVPEIESLLRLGRTFADIRVDERQMERNDMGLPPFTREESQRIFYEEFNKYLESDRLRLKVRNFQGHPLLNQIIEQLTGPDYLKANSIMINPLNYYSAVLDFIYFTLPQVKDFRLKKLMAVKSANMLSILKKSGLVSFSSILKPKIDRVETVLDSPDLHLCGIILSKKLLR